MATLILLLMSLALAPPASAPAAETPLETPLEAALRETRQSIQQEDAAVGLSPAGPAALSELFRGELQDGFLIVETSLPPDRRRTVRPLAGDADASAVITIGAPGPGGRAAAVAAANGPATRPFAAEPISLIVRRAGGPSPGDFVTYTHLDANLLDGQVVLARDRESLARTENVHLNQLRVGADADEPAVSLQINRSYSQEPAKSSNVRVEAESLADLRRREPALFEEFVRPMLAEVGLSSAFDGEVRAAATQLFLDKLAVDAATTRRVEELVPQLDADGYAERAAAQAALESLGRPGATALLKFESAALSPEQASRVAAALSPYRPLSAEQAEQRGEDAGFLRNVAKLDGGPDDAALRDLAAARLGELGDPATRPVGGIQ